MAGTSSPAQSLLPPRRGSPWLRSPSRRCRRSSGQRLVEDQTVALVVVDHGTAFVGVVVRAFHDAATAGLNGLGRGVDIGGLDPDDDLPGDGMVHRGRPCEGDRTTVESG